MKNLSARTTFLSVLIITLISIPILASADALEETCPENMPSSAADACEAHLKMDPAKKEIDEILKQLASKATTEGAAKALYKTQKSWEEFVNQACEYENIGDTGGSGHSGLMVACESRYTLRRLEDLQVYASCVGNGCPE